MGAGAKLYLLKELAAVSSSAVLFHYLQTRTLHLLFILLYLNVYYVLFYFTFVCSVLPVLPLTQTLFRYFNGEIIK